MMIGVEKPVPLQPHAPHKTQRPTPSPVWQPIKRGLTRCVALPANTVTVVGGGGGGGGGISMYHVAAAASEPLPRFTSPSGAA